MKAQTKTCSSSRPAELALQAGEGYRISRPLPENIGDTEMQQCFLKLKELVPTIPHNKKVSKVALLQHVIDYILDLELTLEFHPNAVALAPGSISMVERRPLAESTQVNTQSQQTSHQQTSVQPGSVKC